MIVKHASLTDLLVVNRFVDDSILTAGLMLIMKKYQKLLKDTAVYDIADCRIVLTGQKQIENKPKFIAIMPR